MPIRVLAVAGTRPEAVKLAPVVRLLKNDRGFRVRLLATGQHRALLSGALKTFGLRPDRDLRVMRPRQPLSRLLAAVTAGVGEELSRRTPDLVLVQGDTTSALGAALAAFARGVPVAHLEAGLRSGDLLAPYPEEFNRVVIDALSAVHLAPTARAARNVPGAYVTGNTVVDALRSFSVAKKKGRPYAVVTLHRRESHGAVMRGLVSALARAAARVPDLDWVVVAHPNPAARAPLKRLAGGRIRVVPPLPYPQFIALLSRAAFAATDSGGIQEEAPSLGVPYLVMRRVTERPEGLAKWGTLVGVEPRAVEAALVKAARSRRRPRGKNPFGDGKAAQRVVAALKHWTGFGPRPKDFK